jgi:hypothetical protein
MVIGLLQKYENSKKIGKKKTIFKLKTQLNCDKIPPPPAHKKKIFFLEKLTIFFF